MKPNTQRSIPCDQIGTLSLVGFADQVATFVAIDLHILEPAVLQKHMENSGFKFIVVTDSVGGAKKTTIVFSRSVAGELRNPKGLLKSVRNKLHKAINDAEQEMWNRVESSPEDEDWGDPFADEPDGDEEDNAAEYHAQQEFAQRLPSFIAKGDTRFFS